MELSIERGCMNEEGLAKYREGRISFLTKHLNLWKNNSMNQCKKCKMTFHIRGNRGDCCQKGGSHDPKYDFEKDPENVLNCEI